MMRNYKNRVVNGKEKGRIERRKYGFGRRRFEEKRARTNSLEQREKKRECVNRKADIRSG